MASAPLRPWKPQKSALLDMLRKRFQFSLEKVLHLRRHETLVAEQQLSVELQKRRVKELEFERLKTSLQEASLSRPGEGRVSSARLRNASAQCAEVERRVMLAERQLKQIDERIERARQRVTRSRTAQESLEVLRDNQWQRFRSDEAAEETSSLDEHALSIYLRK